MAIVEVSDLTKLLLDPAQQERLRQSLVLLETGDWAGFYQRESQAVEQILFVQTAEEWLDFCAQQSLEPECFCFAFLCGQGKGLQLGGYQQDVAADLLAFLAGLGRDTPAIRGWLEAANIDIDWEEPEPFQRDLERLNQLLGSQDLQLVVWQDSVYCDCQYTLALLESREAARLAQTWESENFQIIG